MTILTILLILSALFAPVTPTPATPTTPLVGQCTVSSWDVNGVWISWYSASMTGDQYYATFRLDSYNGHPTLITGTDPGWIVEGSTIKMHLSWPFLFGETWKLSGLICFDGRGYQEAAHDYWYAWLNLPFLRR